MGATVAANVALILGLFRFFFLSLYQEEWDMKTIYRNSYSGESITREVDRFDFSGEIKTDNIQRVGSDTLHRMRIENVHTHETRTIEAWESTKGYKEGTLVVGKKVHIRGIAKKQYCGKEQGPNYIIQYKAMEIREG